MIGAISWPIAIDSAYSAPADAAPRRRWRGCLVGCFLLILLAALLFVGGPLVLNILREEQQQQRSLEPQPVQTR
jgi:hypothetical protein